MKGIIESLINGNNKFQWKILQEKEKMEIDRKFPRLPLLILTCMDSRIDVHRIFQLNHGDALVLRNAGNQYTEDVLRSILIAIHEYGVKDIIVLGHLDCGMRKVQMDELRQKLNFQVLKQIGQTSVNYHFALQRFFKPFADEIANIKNQVDRLKMTKGIPSGIGITGMLYDPLTGWVFQENEFKLHLSYGNFMHNYQQILQQKRMNHIDFLETIESEIIGPKILESNETIERPEPIEIPEKTEQLTQNSEITKENEFNEMQLILDKNTQLIKHSMNNVSKIQIPKIFIPKIKVYIPKVNKFNEEA
ncbi:MAG: beta-class carbonic anhydrase [Candidatus Hermodarchaeota archaeon]